METHGCMIPAARLPEGGVVPGPGNGRLAVGWFSVILLAVWGCSCGGGSPYALAGDLDALDRDGLSDADVSVEDADAPPGDVPEPDRGAVEVEDATEVADEVVPTADAESHSSDADVEDAADVAEDVVPTGDAEADTGGDVCAEILARIESWLDTETRCVPGESPFCTSFPMDDFPVVFPRGEASCCHLPASWEADIARLEDLMWQFVRAGCPGSPRSGCCDGIPGVFCDRSTGRCREGYE